MKQKHIFREEPLESSFLVKASCLYATGWHRVGYKVGLHRASRGWPPLSLLIAQLTLLHAS